jgi:RecB family exonuclease
VKVPPPPSLEELLSYYEQNWLSAGYESPEEEARYKEYGKEILAGFHQAHSQSFRMPLTVEKPFLMDIDGIKLRGYIDRVDKLESGGLAIVDYKSNRELFTADYLQEDLQLTLYQMAAESMWQLPVEQLTLYHLRSNTPCACPPRDEGRLEAARQLVREVADNIAEERFPATENEYCPCDFAEHCPYYRHSYVIKEAADSGQQAQLPGIVASEAVERYASLRRQIKELEKKAEEEKQALVAFCQSEGLSRVFGTEHTATFRKVERTGFDEGEVRQALEEAGLWEKVLCFDPSLVMRLLSDSGVAPDIKEKLKALQKVVSSYTQLYIRSYTAEEE